jgi:hypothetical protein
MDLGVVGVIVAFFVFVVIFLVCRAIVLWYWRVGEMIDLLQSIDERLERMESRGP